MIYIVVLGYGMPPSMEIVMPRPFTGKTHTGIRHITRPNGDVYVYERVTQYDPQTKLFGMQDRIC